MMSQNNKNDIRITPLGFNYAYDTPSDPEYPLLNTISTDPNINDGWSAERYCSFPQVLIIKFNEVVILKHIRLLFHQYKIPKRIDLFFFNALSFSDWNLDCRVIQFERLGHIVASSNEDNNHQLREMKSVNVNLKCLFLKLQLDECYYSKLNQFNQVGLIRVECFGRGVGKELVAQLALTESDNCRIRPSNEVIDLLIKDDDFDDISKSKIRLLKDTVFNEKDKDIKEELNSIIDKIRLFAKKVLKLIQLELNYKHLNNRYKAIETRKEIIDIQKFINDFPIPIRSSIDESSMSSKNAYLKEGDHDGNQDGFISHFNNNDESEYQHQANIESYNDNENSNDYNYDNNDHLYTPHSNQHSKSNPSPNAKENQSKQILQNHLLKKKLIQESHQNEKSIITRENILYQSQLNF